MRKQQVLLTFKISVYLPILVTYVNYYEIFSEETLLIIWLLLPCGLRSSRLRTVLDSTYRTG